MCGIWAFLELVKSSNKNDYTYQKQFEDFMNLQPRGPDSTSFQILKNVSVGFHRLAIMDPTFHANQPYIIEDDQRTIVFICNGEIYNFKDLIEEHNLPIHNNSDCMTIPRLYLKYVSLNKDGMNDTSKFRELFKSNIKGEFAFILFEFDNLQNLKEVIACRDQIGVRPLYEGMNDNSYLFSSEIKGMKQFNGRVQEFAPGTLLQIYLDNFGKVDSVNRYNFSTVYSVKPIDPATNPNEELLLKNVRNAVINSVKRRLTADRPIAFLLSGGLDSSLVCCIASKLLGKPINTYCCAIKDVDSTDLKYAKLVANYIKSNHTEVLFTVEEALAAIPEVIKMLESFCITSIRASVAQYMVSKHIASKTDAKVILTGEGSDEVTSGYLYNYYAPNETALHNGAIEYVQKIHYYDGRRVDRIVSGLSCEARIALLDPEFITAYWQLPSLWRMPTYKNCEKYYLRKAFDGTRIMNEETLWRKKEAFSDGISSTTKSWFQIIQEHIETLVTDEEFKINHWNCNTKEEYYYKKIFVENYGEKRLNILPGNWQPKWRSNGEVVKGFIDPSARVLDVYKKEDQEVKK